jgi:hypothetical protein
MSEETSTGSARDDFWQVQLPSGEVCVWTAEELDEAFQSGQIHERSLVKQLGEENWSTLAQVAGLDEADAPPITDADQTQQMAPLAPQVVPAPPDTMPSSLAPLAVSVTPSQVSAPPPAMAISVAPQSNALPDVDLDAPPKFGSKGRVFLIAGALAVIFGALGLVAVKVGGTAAAGAAPNAVSTAFKGDPHHMSAGTPADDPFIAKPLTDEQKRALLEADKKRQEELDKKRRALEAERAAQQPAQRRPAGKASDPFVKSGNKYDPLNGNL